MIGWLIGRLVGPAGPGLLASAAVAVLAIGFGAGEAWEHRGPQRFPLSIAGESLALQRDVALGKAAFWETRARYWHGFYGEWKGAAERCEGARGRESKTAAGRVETGASDRMKTADRSFNSGYAAGRVAGVLDGRKTCGATHDPQPTSDPGADPIGDLVDSSLFNGGEARSRGVVDWNAGAYRPDR